MRHFRTIQEAVEAASASCKGWVSVETGDYIEKEAALILAQGIDMTEAQNHARENAEDEIFYMASDEGAVGVTSRFEYLVQWILLPMFLTKEEMSLAAREMIEEYERIQAANEAGENAAAQTQQNVSSQSNVNQKPRFCANCGSKLVAGMQFCMNCGTKIEMV